MTRHVTLIPLQEEFFVPNLTSNRETSGGRGAPEMNFDVLNLIEKQDRSQLGVLQQRSTRQQADLSTILEGVHTTVRKTLVDKRDSDLIFTARAEELSLESEKIRQNAMEAAADPFNELKALFGNTPSMADWAAKHSAIQNDLSVLQRQYTSTAAGYNFNLDSAAMDVSQAQQKLALTTANITSIGAASSAVIAKIAAQSAIVTQQLDTIHTRKDLQAELDDPNGQLPKDLVRRRLLTLDLAMAEIADAKSKAGKSRLELMAKLFDVYTRFSEFIPTSVMDDAIRTGQDVFVPLFGTIMSPQQAKILKVQQMERAQVDATKLAELTRNTMAGQQAITQIVDMFARVAGPGDFGKLGQNSQNVALGFDLASLPEEMKKSATLMMDIKNRAEILQLTLADPNFKDSNLRAQMQLLVNATNLEAIDLRSSIEKQVSEEAQIGVKGKEAKAEAARFARSGVVKSPIGAEDLLAQGTKGVVALHGPGYNAGYTIFSTIYNQEVSSTLDLFDEDGKLKEGAANTFLAQTQRGDVETLAVQTALGQLDADGRNKIQVAIASDWLELTFNFAVREIEARHASEPEVVAGLKSLRSGTIALNPMFASIVDEQGKPLDTANVLFSALAVMVRGLEKSGALSKESTLIHELYGLLLGDTSDFGDPNRQSTLYQQPQMRAMTTASTKEGAALAFKIFQNQPHQFLVSAMQNVVRNIPIDNLDLSEQIIQREAALLAKPHNPTEAGIKERIALNAEIRVLREKEESTSLTNIMQQITRSQANK